MTTPPRRQTGHLVSRLADGATPAMAFATGQRLAAGDALALPVLYSEDLLSGHRTVEIVHAGARYRLSVTSLGKLILTK